MSNLEKRLQSKLTERQNNGSIRSLLPLPDSSQSSISSSNNITQQPNKIDFSSNDYLGLARCPNQYHKVTQLFQTNHNNDTENDIIKTNQNNVLLGATGSRLLSGNTTLFRTLEHQLQQIHNRPSALLCNSGYDANLSLLSSLLTYNDYVVMDELVHNSLIMGVKMSRIRQREDSDYDSVNTNVQTTSDFQNVQFFKHNNIQDLEQKLKTITSHIMSSQESTKMNSRLSSEKSTIYEPIILVVVESVYSMDGDIAPLAQILDISHLYNACVIVDEAHGLGVYGPTNKCDLILPELQQQNHHHHQESNNTSSTIMINSLNDIVHDSSFIKSKNLVGGTGVLAALNLEHHPALLATVYTYGKAAGCHGAVIISSKIVTNYLVNYARPFIYSTALPPHSIFTIRCAYESMMGVDGERRRKHMFYLVKLFRCKLLQALRCDDKSVDNVVSSFLLPSPSPIQAVLCPGNEQCIELATYLRENGSFDIYAIRSPTVPKGSERLRIIIHYHNTEEEVVSLVQLLSSKLMQIINIPRSKL